MKSATLYRKGIMISSRRLCDWQIDFGPIYFVLAELSGYSYRSRLFSIILGNRISNRQLNILSLKFLNLSLMLDKIMVGHMWSTHENYSIILLRY